MLHQGIDSKGHFIQNGSGKKHHFKTVEGRSRAIAKAMGKRSSRRRSRGSRRRSRGGGLQAGARRRSRGSRRRSRSSRRRSSRR